MRGHVPPTAPCDVQRRGAAEVTAHKGVPPVCASGVKNGEEILLGRKGRGTGAGRGRGRARHRPAGSAENCDMQFSFARGRGRLGFDRGADEPGRGRCDAISGDRRGRFRPAIVAGLWLPRAHPRDRGHRGPQGMPARAPSLLGGGRKPPGDQVLVRGAPHRTGRLAAMPSGRACGAVSALIRLMRPQHRAPGDRQAGQLGTSHRQQCVGFDAMC